MFVLTPLASIGFLFLIIPNMTLSSASHHPQKVKTIKGKKMYKKDYKWIADLYKFDLVRHSFIPPKDFCQLRELTRYRFKLVA